MRVFTGRRVQINHLLISPDGRYLAAYGWASSKPQTYAHVWRMGGDTNPLFALTSDDPDRQLSQVAFTPNSEHILSGIQGWWSSRHLLSGGVMAEEALTTLKPFVVSGDGRWAVSFGCDNELGSLRLRVAENEQSAWKERWSREFRYVPRTDAGRAISDNRENFWTLWLSDNGTRLLLQFDTIRSHFAGGGRLIRVLDTATGADVFSREETPKQITGQMVVGPVEQVLLLDGRAFHVVDPFKPGAPTLTRTNQSRLKITAAAFSPNGKLLATTSNDTTVTMWDTATWQPTRQYGWEIGRLRAVAFAPDGLTCAAGSDIGKVVLFDVDG